MKIYTIIICYHPDIPHLISFTRLLIESGSKVILVDNTPNSTIKNETLLNECEIIMMGENTGIAKAQNTGIRRAIETGAEVLVFFDQDSLIEPDFMETLLSQVKVGEAIVVAPVYYDDPGGAELPSLKLNEIGLLDKVYPGQGEQDNQVDVVISSGTGASKETFQIAGLMDEDFFIDLVDTEWCLRCRKHGVPIKIVPGAKMRHRIGKATHKLGRTDVLIHSPTRCYYQIRNSFLLFRKKSVPIVMATKELVTILINRLLLLFFVKQKRVYLSAYFQAISHGLKGVKGKRPGDKL